MPPVQIQAKNKYGRIFTAIICSRDGRNGTEFIYNPAKDAFRYRVQIPGVELSMITIDVPMSEIREFVNTGKPVQIRPQ